MSTVDRAITTETSAKRRFIAVNQGKRDHFQRYPHLLTSDGPMDVDNPTDGARGGAWSKSWVDSVHHSWHKWFSRPFSLQNLMDLTSAVADVHGTHHSLTNPNKLLGIVGLYCAIKLSNRAFVGRGSSRVAYALSSKLALKVARNEFGAEQNANEIACFAGDETPFVASLKAARLVPVVLRHGQGNSWILTELVRPLKSEKEFAELLDGGLTLTELIHVSHTIEDLVISRGESLSAAIKSTEKALNSMTKTTTASTTGIGHTTKKQTAEQKADTFRRHHLKDRLGRLVFVSDLVSGKRGKKVADLVKVLAHSIVSEPDETSVAMDAVVDLGGLGQWGKGADGRLVLLDFGLSLAQKKQNYYGE